MSHLFTSLDAFTHQGFKAVGTPNHYNEDRLVTGTHIFAVIDGATAITDADMGGINTSAYTAKFLAEFLYANDFADTRTAKDLLLQAGSAFNAHLAKRWPDIVALGKLGPCAAVALIKRHPDGTISHANLSDCAIIANIAGAWQALSVHSARHAALDDALAEAIFAEIDKGTPPAQASRLPHIVSMRNQNRTRLNIEYGVFNAEPEMANFITSGTMNTADIKAVAMFSDGMFWPKGDDDAMRTTAKMMADHGVRAYYNQLKTLKDADPDFKTYRRLKHMDDATGIVLELKQKVLK